MTGPTLIVVLTVLILIYSVRLVVNSLQQDAPGEATVDKYLEASAALKSVLFEATTIRRVLSGDDLIFISTKTPSEVRRLFLKERKKLAIQWLREAKKQVSRLMNLHLKLARYSAAPSPATEIKLVASYLFFSLASTALLLALLLRGPFAISRMVCFTARLVESFGLAANVQLQGTPPVRF